VDERRQRKPSYFLWKEMNAIATIEARVDNPNGFTATVTPNAPARIPSYPLRNYRLTWQALGEDGKAVALGERQFSELATPQTVTGTLPPGAARRPTKLVLTLLRPAGTVAAEKTIDWR
jgi:hypothetical protein